ncbi:hypothetical protein GGF50DRAFT_44924 [Schizophyllum commune]
MVGALNLFLTDKFTWRQASILVARTQGHSEKYARSIRTWLTNYLRDGSLPLHRHGRTRSHVLNDEDFSSRIQLILSERVKAGGYITARDVCEIVASEEMQTIFKKAGVNKPSISERTGRRWLNKLSWRYQRKRSGMYIDGHERPDVVAEREKFIRRWREYERRFIHFDDNGDPLPAPPGFPVPGHRFRLIPVTHDESTFYQNDGRRIYWQHTKTRAAPQPKGEGQSIMVSDFLTSEWGRLRASDDDNAEDARVVFKAGKNRDGYFTAVELLAQVDHAIDIFEERTRGFAQGLFLFDNAPSHQKRAPDALSARKMPKDPRSFQLTFLNTGPHATWTHNNGPRMRDGYYGRNKTRQPLYYPEDHPTMPGWFKGMEQIIRERGLWPAGGRLNAQCDGFKCPPDRTDCCCRRLLFTQPDFEAQKSALQELVESRGHLCDFYPKYHCELNFIEQYWGAAKFRYRTAPRSATMDEMEKLMLTCLDEVPLLQIRRYANRSKRYIHAYSEGLTGAQAAWANRRYHGHRSLPPHVLAKVKASIAP